MLESISQEAIDNAQLARVISTRDITPPGSFEAVIEATIQLRWYPNRYDEIAPHEDIMIAMQQIVGREVIDALNRESKHRIRTQVSE